MKSEHVESYGFFPQMKAEGIAFKKEKSGAIVIGTNPGFHNGVLIVRHERLLHRERTADATTADAHRGRAELYARSAGDIKGE